MTELEKAADNYTEKAENILRYSDGWEEYSDWEYVKKAYIKGAEWAIDKTCEWLENNLVRETPIISCGHVHINFGNAIKKFRKAMEN